MPEQIETEQATQDVGAEALHEDLRHHRAEPEQAGSHVEPVQPNQSKKGRKEAAAIGARVEPVPIPWDCADGFFEAYWRQPEAYLDEGVRRGVSVWARVGPQAEQRAVRSLRDDLASGRWAERNGDLLTLDQADLGLRLLIA